jgi:hypothetical protein
LSIDRRPSSSSRRSRQLSRRWSVFISPYSAKQQGTDTAQTITMIEKAARRNTTSLTPHLPAFLPASAAC